jgi:tetratricopeptide (TPR) repeat protein
MFRAVRAISSAQRAWVQRNSAAILLSGGLCLVPTIAGAESVTDGSRIREGASVAADEIGRVEHAKALFESGVANGRKGDWEAALRDFEASSRLHPTCAALSNQARSLSQLGQPVRALETYEAVLRQYADRMEAVDRRRIEDEIEKLRSLVSERLVEAAPAEATLSTDDPPAASPAEPVSRPITAPAEKASASVLPAAKRGRSLPLFAEAWGGLAFAASFAGAADASCAKTVTFADGSEGRGCSHRTRPWGGAAGLRLGYRLGNVSLDVALGYLSMTERLRRSLELQGDLEQEAERRFKSMNAEDELRLAGLLLAIGGTYQPLGAVPLKLRMSAGVFAAGQNARVRGSFSEIGAASDESNWRLDLVEDRKQLWIPFMAPEVRCGIRLYRQLSLDLGVAFLLLFAPSRVRVGDSWGLAELRRGPLLAGGDRGIAARLPSEVALGTIVAVTPGLGVRWDF